MAKQTRKAGVIDPALYYTIDEAAEIQRLTPRTLRKILKAFDAKVFVGARNHCVIPGWSLAEVFEAGLANWSETRGDNENESN